MTPAAADATDPRRAHALRLGIVLFLASESLLFAGLLGIYAAGRWHHPADFAAGVREDLRWLGSLNTGILLVSSMCAALAVERTRADRPRAATRWLLAAVGLGIGFLALKGWEYAVHIRDGILPGGQGGWFPAHPGAGLALFFNLYYLLTGLHALHLLVGLTWLLALLPRARHGRRGTDAVELGTMYWHFVDMVWVYLWPLFYLVGAGP